MRWNPTKYVFWHWFLLLKTGHSYSCRNKNNTKCGNSKQKSDAAVLCGSSLEWLGPFTLQSTVERLGKKILKIVQRKLRLEAKSEQHIRQRIKLNRSRPCFSKQITSGIVCVLRIARVWFWSCIFCYLFFFSWMIRRREQTKRKLTKLKCARLGLLNPKFPLSLTRKTRCRNSTCYCLMQFYLVMRYISFQVVLAQGTASNSDTVSVCKLASSKMDNLRWTGIWCRGLVKLPLPRFLNSNCSYRVTAFFYLSRLGRYFWYI